MRRLGTSGIPGIPGTTSEELVVGRHTVPVGYSLRFWWGYASRTSGVVRAPHRTLAVSRSGWLNHGLIDHFVISVIIDGEPKTLFAV